MVMDHEKHSIAMYSNVSTMEVLSHVAAPVLMQTCAPLSDTAIFPGPSSSTKLTLETAQGLARALKSQPMIQTLCAGPREWDWKAQVPAALGRGPQEDPWF